MSLPPMVGELNPTQQLYARTLGTRRMELIEEDVYLRYRNEPVFRARVDATTGVLMPGGSRGLLRASQEIIKTILHLDDVWNGRWQAPEHKTDPLARISDGVHPFEIKVPLSEIPIAEVPGD